MNFKNLVTSIRRAPVARFAAVVTLTVGGFVAVGAAATPAQTTNEATLFWPPHVTPVSITNVPVVGQG